MSVEAITWALRQPIQHSSAKFVLVVLANCASAEDGRAWPSVVYLASATGQDRKTVMTNLRRLQEWGMIEDTGRRVGATKQVVVYQLLCGPDLFAPESPEKSTKTGTVPKTEQSQNRNSTENGTVPFSPGNSTVFPAKGPKNGTRNRQEPKRTETEREGTRADAPAGESSDAAATEPPPRAPAGSRLPPSWEPSEEDMAFARQHRPELDLTLEADKFRDYWAAQSGSKGVKLDWAATWRNWIRRADAPAAGRGQPVPGSVAPRTPPADWRQQSESPLQAEIAWIRQLHAYGEFGEGPEADAERYRLIAEAKAGAAQAVPA